MKFRDFASKGEVFKLPNGKMVLLPLEVINGKSGGVIFRIGDNTYWFYPDKEKKYLVYDGHECKCSGDDESKKMRTPEWQQEYVRLAQQALENRGKKPDDSYFGEEE